jgi:uncharacterized protein (TIGR00266 family)
MDFRIDGNPDYGELTVALEPGEKLLAESGAMSRMAVHLELQSRVMGGVLPALGRKLLGGESFFLGEYQSSAGGWVALSPRYPGTVLHRRLEGEGFVLTAGSFLACSPGVRLVTRFGGLRSFFSGRGVFLFECSGQGDLFYHSFGAVLERELNGELVVDTGHVVAWEPGLDYRITGMGGLKQTLLSGEGLVMRFSGRGRLTLQTRTLRELAGWIAPFCLGKG